MVFSNLKEIITGFFVRNDDKGISEVRPQKELMDTVELMNRQRHTIISNWLVKVLKPIYGKYILKFVDDREALDRELHKINMKLTVECGSLVKEMKLGKIFNGKAPKGAVRMDTCKLWYDDIPRQALVLKYYAVTGTDDDRAEIHWENFKIIRHNRNRWQKIAENLEDKE